MSVARTMSTQHKLETIRLTGTIVTPFFELFTLTVTPFQQNMRVLLPIGLGGERLPATVIDPGGDLSRILSLLESLGTTCQQIWLTHAHLDHCGAVAGLIRHSGARLFGHAAEVQLRASVSLSASFFGLPEAEFENCPEPDVILQGGEVLMAGTTSWQVRFTPGHSVGHVCYYHQETETLLAGDTVFSNSIGRTDLPGGSHEVLLASIQREILSLPDAVQILPGHGPDTTVGRERRENPFLTSS